MSQKIIHWRIAKIAKALANEAYEILAKENAFYERNRSQEWWVRKSWKDFIPYARQALIDILAKDYSFEIGIGTMTREAVEEMKEEVFAAIQIDSSYKAPPQHLHAVN